MKRCVGASHPLMNSPVTASTPKKATEQRHSSETVRRGAIEGDCSGGADSESVAPGWPAPSEWGRRSSSAEAKRGAISDNRYDRKRNNRHYRSATETQKCDCRETTGPDL